MRTSQDVIDSDASAYAKQIAADEPVLYFSMDEPLDLNAPGAVLCPTIGERGLERKPVAIAGGAGGAGGADGGAGGAGGGW
jgi:hypothetical protein